MTKARWAVVWLLLAMMLLWAGTTNEKKDEVRIDKCALVMTTDGQECR